MKISIIIPVYNAESYIERCLDSVLNQSYQNIEIIIVDDGSMDFTLERIKKYTDDLRINLIEQKHKGPNAARKKGIEVASGDYVMFVDADDFIEKDATKILADILLNNDVESVKFNMDDYGSGKLVYPVSYSEAEKEELDSEEASELLLTTYKMNSLCTRIYKKEILQNITAFEYDIRYGEDFLINLEICKRIKKTLVIGDVLYHYCGDNSDSTTRIQDKKNVLKNLSDRIFVSKKAIEYVVGLSIDTTKRSSVIFAQLKMIVGSIQKIALIGGYKKEVLIKDVCTILPRNYFSEVDVDELKEYINSLSFPMRIKNKAIILAIVYADYKYIWRYIRVIRLYKRLRFRRRG